MSLTPMDRRAALRLVLSGASTALLAACTTAPAAPTPAPTAAPAKPTAPPAQATAAPAQPTAASAQPTSPPATVAVAATAKPAAAPARTGGTLRLGMVGDVSTLDGHNTTPNQFDTTWSVFDRLISYDTKLQPQPELAESWDLSSDLTQIKLNLRKGVQWHSGREFTSDDVKYNLLRVRDPKLASVVGVLATQSAWFTEITTPDKYTAVL
ncbi:MAG TPA: ABC transporter substrate-binding protein, partial [Chloroflexota bacterium]|nr:ABC transporter substrate-binding protein [Chloroflexota bacterium]